MERRKAAMAMYITNTCGLSPYLAGHSYHEQYLGRNRKSLDCTCFGGFDFCRPCFHALFLPAVCSAAQPQASVVSLYSEYRQRKPLRSGRIARSAIFISAVGNRHHQIVLIGLLVRPGDGITLVTRYAVEFQKASHGVHCWIVFFMLTGFWVSLFLL